MVGNIEQLEDELIDLVVEYIAELKSKRSSSEEVDRG